MIRSKTRLFAYALLCASSVLSLIKNNTYTKDFVTALQNNEIDQNAYHSPKLSIQKNYIVNNRIEVDFMFEFHGHHNGNGDDALVTSIQSFNVQNNIKFDVIQYTLSGEYTVSSQCGFNSTYQVGPKNYYENGTEYQDSLIGFINEGENNEEKIRFFNLKELRRGGADYCPPSSGGGNGDGGPGHCTDPSNPLCKSSADTMYDPEGQYVYPRYNSFGKYTIRMIVEYSPIDASKYMNLVSPHVEFRYDFKTNKTYINALKWVVEWFWTDEISGVVVLPHVIKNVYILVTAIIASASILTWPNGDVWAETSG